MSSSSRPLSEQAADQPPAPPRVRTIRDLIAALDSAAMQTRLDVLKAIQQQPQAALALGAWQGKDLIDVLLIRSAGVSETAEWMSFVAALSSFHNPRVTQFFLDMLAHEEAAQLLFVAASYLSSCVAWQPSGVWSRDEPAFSQRGEDSKRTSNRQVPRSALPGDYVGEAVLEGLLLPLLLQNENPIRARAVAPLLQGCPFLTDAARLRTALLDAGLEEAPSFTLATSELWLAELAGPFQLEARIRLKSYDPAAWTLLASQWDRLDDDNRLWLLAWGSEGCGWRVAEILPAALRNDSLRIRVQALQMLATLPESGVPESTASLAVGFLTDPNPEVRAAAVSAGPAGQDWRAIFARETAPAVRSACIPQLLRQEGEGAIPDLIGFLRSNDWQLRAVSAEALVRLGTAVAGYVKPLVHDQDERVRIAAVRILLDLQQDDWLKNEFQLDAVAVA